MAAVKEAPKTETEFPVESMGLEGLRVMMMDARSEAHAKTPRGVAIRKRYADLLEEEKRKKPRELRPVVQIFPIGYVHGLRSAIVLKGTTRADLVRPALWSIVGEHLKSFDVVHVVDEDDRFFARILVRAKEPDAATAPQLVELEYVELPPRIAGKHELPPNYRIEFNATENSYVPFFLGPTGEKRLGGEGRKTWEEARAVVLDHARTVAPGRQVIYHVEDE
jgi:hypothetical protein